MTTSANSQSAAEESHFLFVQCSSCSSRYRVPVERLSNAPEPWFHCSRCDTVFQAMPEERRPNRAPEISSQLSADAAEEEQVIEANLLFPDEEKAQKKQGQRMRRTSLFPELEERESAIAIVSERKEEQSQRETVVVEFEKREPFQEKEQQADAFLFEEEKESLAAKELLTNEEENEEEIEKDFQEEKQVAEESSQVGSEPLENRAEPEEIFADEPQLDAVSREELSLRSKISSSLEESNQLPAGELSSAPASTLSKQIEVERASQERNQEVVPSSPAVAASLAFTRESTEEESAHTSIGGAEEKTKLPSKKTQKEPEQVVFGFQETPTPRRAEKPAPLADQFERASGEQEEIFNTPPKASDEGAVFEEEIRQVDTQKISVENFQVVQAERESLSSVDTQPLPNFQLSHESARIVSPTRSLLLLASPLIAFLAVLFIAGQSLAHPDLRWLNESLFPATPKAPPPELRVSEAQIETVALADGRQVYTLRGVVENRSRESVGAILIEGALFDDNGAVLETVRVPLGSDLSGSDLEVLSLPIVQDMIQDANFRKATLKPSSTREFLLVFPSAKASKARFYTTRIHSARAQN